jgi:hypothetical protein
MQQDSLPVVACGTGENFTVTFDTGPSSGTLYKISNKLFLNPIYTYYEFLVNARAYENN